jgi:NhaP-type Na+/H+ or K+/H+ antiporter
VYVVVGLLLILMALAGWLVKRLPVTTPMLYLAVGVAIGPFGAGLLALDAVSRSALLEPVTEIAVIVSLFTAGLKLRAPLADPIWRPAVRLATVTLALTVGFVAAAGLFGLGLPLGAAVLLGAILAPTDPVLASDVQVADPDDRDRLRVTLTGEAGLNDGTAFPFVMLGLGLAGARDLGTALWRWLALDVVWAVGAGLAIGWALGTVVARLAGRLGERRREAPGGEEYLALGLMALAYGLALAAHAYGFLAVFAAGLAMRTEAGTASEVLAFNEQLERLLEVGLVLLVGAMLGPGALTIDTLWFVPLLFLVVRPLSVGLALARARVPANERRLAAWFGIRGIGSLYYLAYASQHGLGVDAADRIADLALTTIAASVVLHGLSVTPLMRAYERRR